MNGYHKLLVIAVLWALAIPALAQTPVPSDADQTKALNLVRVIFKAEYDKATTPEKKSELAKKMLEQASQSKSDPLSYFVLLRVARDVAVTAGDSKTAIEAIDAMADTFAINAVQMKAQILPKLAQAKVANEAAQITMFDGKTLNGWKSDDYPELWSVWQGAIVGRGQPDKHSYLFFKTAAFVDFEFEGEVKINSTGSSGFYFRATQGEEDPEGYEVQIVGASDGKPRQATGSLFKMAPVEKHLIKNDQWFKLRVTAKGNQITIALDDKTVVEYTDKEKKYRAGYFALQCWAPETEVHFRNLKVRSL